MKLAQKHLASRFIPYLDGLKHSFKERQYRVVTINRPIIRSLAEHIRINEKLRVCIRININEVQLRLAFVYLEML